MTALSRSSPRARTMTRAVDQSKIRRISLRAPIWLGDFVSASATFARVRAAFPSAHLTGGLRPYLRPLLSAAHLFDEVVDTPRASGLGGLCRQVAQMPASRYDLAILLPN